MKTKTMGAGILLVLGLSLFVTMNTNNAAPQSECEKVNELAHRVLDQFRGVIVDAIERGSSIDIINQLWSIYYQMKLMWGQRIQDACY